MKCGNDKCKMNFGETLGCAIWKRSDKCRNFIQADGVPDSSQAPCSLSDRDPDLALLRMVVSAVTHGPEDNVAPHIWLQIEQALKELSDLKANA